MSDAAKAWRESPGNWMGGGCAEYIYGYPEQTMGCATGGEMCQIKEFGRGRGARIAYKNVLDNVSLFICLFVCLFTYLFRFINLLQWQRFHMTTTDGQIKTRPTALPTMATSVS